MRHINSSPPDNEVNEEKEDFEKEDGRSIDQIIQDAWEHCESHFNQNFFQMTLFSLIL